MLIERSDSYLFHLPNMGKILINERNAEYFPQYPLGYTQEEDQDSHAVYIKRMKWHIDLIKEDIIESHIDTGYLNQTSNSELEIYHVAISERTLGFFSGTRDFFKWLYPILPEDPCFLSKGKCIFQCIAHENLCYLYIDDREIVKFLKRNHVEIENMDN